MKKISRLLVLLLSLLSIVVLASSCQNIFGTSTDIERVYGDWSYVKDGGFEIRLSLYKNGTYHYEEIASYGKTLYENTGKFSLSSKSLVLKDIDTSDDNRYSVYSISMKDSTEYEDILDLVPTLAKKYTFKRVGAASGIASVSITDSTKKTISDSTIKLDIEGTWASDSIGTVNIAGDRITIVPTSGDAFSAVISSADGNRIKLTEDSPILDEYREITYFTVNNNLYVIFPLKDNGVIAFTSN